MTRDDCGAMFSEADIVRVSGDIEAASGLLSCQIRVAVMTVPSVFGPSLVILGTVPGVGTARIAMNVDAWARISSHPSPVARGCMWLCSIMDQVLAQAHYEWAMDAPVEDEDEDDDD